MVVHVISEPKVSVILPTYNMGAYVGGAIQSILDQSVPHWELLVIDDGSSDSTRDVVAPYLIDGRIKYHYQPNAGLSAARNAGLALARGSYIGLIDADDLWLPTKLALQLPILERSASVGVVYGRIQRIDSNGVRFGDDRTPGFSGNITNRLFKFNFVPVGTALFRRSATAIVGGFDERLRMAEDWDFWLRMSVHYEFHFVEEKMYLYRVWDGQMSKNWKGRYDAAFDIMNRFTACNPGLIPAEVLRDAMISSYFNRARDRASAVRDYRGALDDISLALKSGGSVLSAARLGARLLLESIHIMAPP